MRLALALLALAGLALWALGVGAGDLPLARIPALLLQGGDTREALILHGVRLPRVLAALAVGAVLAPAGLILQTVTRNPLADPGILGVNAGAAFAVVLALALGLVAGRGGYVAVAVPGAALAVALVWLLGASGRQGPLPLRLTLAGVVTGGFLAAATAALLILDARTLDAARIWTLGSLQGLRMADVVAVLPWGALALLLALLTRRQVALLAMGPATARGLGLDLRLWWGLVVALVAGLAGVAVALAGPVGFVGLMVPHALRLLTGMGYGRALLPAMLAGAALVLLADTLPRALLGRDVPVGVALALLGAPVFIWLAARGPRAAA